MLYCSLKFVRKLHLLVVMMEASNRSCPATRKAPTQLYLMPDILTLFLVASRFIISYCTISLSPVATFSNFFFL
jgi:hypothetical protein